MVNESKFVKDLIKLGHSKNSKKIEKKFFPIKRKKKPKPVKFNWKRFREGSRLAAQLNY